MPQIRTYATVEADKMPQMPAFPTRMERQQVELLGALRDASETAGTDVVRYAVNCVQLRGKTGQVVSTDGSWHAGVDKAPPALFLEASPTGGKSFAHDYTKSDFAVLSLAGKVTVPFGSFSDALVTKEWSPVEPAVEMHKYYVRGVGLVVERPVLGMVLLMLVPVIALGIGGRGGCEPQNRS